MAARLSRYRKPTVAMVRAMTAAQADPGERIPDSTYTHVVEAMWADGHIDDRRRLTPRGRLALAAALRTRRYMIEKHVERVPCEHVDHLRCRTGRVGPDGRRTHAETRWRILDTEVNDYVADCGVWFRTRRDAAAHVEGLPLPEPEEIDHG